ncbi:MAG: ATP-binding cassette domain-containing protein [Bacilli bacterium]|nr:ATP-binding cassette domain-containing protein [Bacilli bacterium]
MKYIKCYNLTKSFKNNLVLNSFNCEFTSNSINFITGSNGSGKSTLISCILEFLNYNGVITTNLEKIVNQPEKVILPDYIKVIDYLKIIGKVHKQLDINKINKLLNLFGIEKIVNKDIIQLSKGMKQKILLIQSLMIEADGYIFDEPLSGLDPLSQQKFVSIIEELFKKNKLIIIVTHFLEQYDISNKHVIDLNKKEYSLNDSITL